MRKTLCLLAALVLLSCVSAFPQGGVNSIVATYTTAAMGVNDTIIKVYSATGVSVSPATLLYVVDLGNPAGEAMRVTATNSTTLTVSRGQAGTRAYAHYSGAMVLLGRPDWFMSYDPVGTCVAATAPVNPWVNISNGHQWLCSTITHTWVPGFGNVVNVPQVTTLVASTAGAITPSGPLFHINGTSAITGFTVPVGGLGRGFCVVPDAAFTTTTADNIAKASTAVANQTICWTWDATNSKYVPTY